MSKKYCSCCDKMLVATRFVNEEARTCDKCRAKKSKGHARRGRPSVIPVASHSELKRLAPRFDRLWRENYLAIKAGLTAKCKGDTHLADDIIVQVHRKAYYAFNRYKGKSSFRVWCIAIGKNIILDHWKKASNHYTFIDDLTVGHSDNAHLYDILPDPDYSAFDKMVCDESLNRLIDSIPIEHRELIIRHAENESYESLASRYNVPIGTIKSRLFRAKKDAARVLREKGYAA